MVQSISAAPGQTVSASAPLLQIAQVSTLWVRVPVFAGDVDNVDPSQPASVTRLGAPGAPHLAKRVTAPLKADATAASVDLYYELPTGLTFRPGERVMVELPLKSTQQGLVVPEAAVLYDIHGDAWVSWTATTPIPPPRAGARHADDQPSSPAALRKARG